MNNYFYKKTFTINTWEKFYQDQVKLNVINEPDF